jgi:hypothetical protein
LLAWLAGLAGLLVQLAWGGQVAIWAGLLSVAEAAWLAKEQKLSNTVVTYGVQGRDPLFHAKWCSVHRAFEELPGRYSGPLFGYPCLGEKYLIY